MKLLLSANSPYARKVRVVIEELGIGQDVELIEIDPRDSSSGLWQFNPLAKVPTLLIGPQTALFDSPVICEYLNAYANASLLPTSPEACWQTRTLVALADGVMDAGVAARLETTRPESERSTAWIDKQMTTIERAFEGLQARLPAYESEINLGSIAIACAIDWVLFRHNTREWLVDKQPLARWFEHFSQRPSMQKTRPGQPLL